jgi:hypothetical protein
MLEQGLFTIKFEMNDIQTPFCTLKKAYLVAVFKSSSVLDSCTPLIQTVADELAADYRTSDTESYGYCT